ncbi:DUF3863 domain-containing protein [Mucilaginibacter corticis]|nr:DUF3863 domain-containing protein [Mucilaginibacter corticis]
MITKKYLLIFTFFVVCSSAVIGQKKQIIKDGLIGHRFLTWNAVIRLNQIEVTRDRNVGVDERSLHTPERVKAYREAIAKGMPGGKITWALSWLALKDTSANYRAIHKLMAEYHKKYGDEVTFIPGGYFANAYNTRAQVNLDLHDALQMVSRIVGNGYRPKSIVAGFLSAENQQYLAEKEGIHVCQGNIWSQFSIDNQDGDGSISYPYYPSKEHFCKPAQGKSDFIDCVNLDGWTIDFLAGRREGFKEGFNSRMGVGPIETIGKYGQEKGTREMMHSTAIHFDKGVELNGFGWVAEGWELCLEYKFDYITEYLKQVKARWPDVEMVTQGEFGLTWRGHYKDNSFDYRFVEQGSGIGGSDIDKEIRWYMNKDFRLALLKDLNKSTGFKVIDLTRYDLKAVEPKDMTRRWSLMGEINQKQTRLQDKPRPIDSISQSSHALIFKRYKNLPKN